VISKDAYVLFYRRRETTATVVINKPINIQQNHIEDEFYSCEEEEEDCSSTSSASFTNLDALD
jgi:hypothetical protein